MPRRDVARGRERGFSFVEILIVMGIISVLVGLGLLAVNLVSKKTPKIKTTNVLQKVRGTIDHWHSRFRTYPPRDATKLGLMSGTSFTVQKLPNLTNDGIESLYLALHIPGFGRSADLSDDELSNTDEDRLEKPFAPTLPGLDLWEIRDAWGNPLVYFPAQDYVEADKNPPTYYTGADSEGVEPQVNPKPWKSDKTGAFMQATSYQLYSMGEDSTPNTDDDVKAWE
jgi:prepilin-type N-terminal cleavage/methylation domain-containing protein